MTDIQNFERLAKEDEKKIKQYRGENERLNQSFKILHEENENHKKFAKLPLNDKFPRKVAKRELKEEIKNTAQIKRKKQSLKSSPLENRRKKNKGSLSQR